MLIPSRSVRPGTSDDTAEPDTAVLEMTQHFSAIVFHRRIFRATALAVRRSMFGFATNQNVLTSVLLLVRRAARAPC